MELGSRGWVADIYLSKVFKIFRSDILRYERNAFEMWLLRRTHDGLLRLRLWFNSSDLIGIGKGDALEIDQHRFYGLHYIIR